MKALVISDVHGDFESLRTILRCNGIIDKDGRRKNSNSWVIQIGDLANCVENSISGDIKCLNTVGTWIDFLIMGNHEIPYFDRDNRFSGFYWNAEIADILDNLANEERIIPSFLAGDYLISHAGWDRSIHPMYQTAEDVRNFLDNLHWNSHYFSLIGKSRGGIHDHGGILWEDFRDLDSSFPQIVGHTQRSGKIRQKKNAVCIDTGAERVSSRQHWKLNTNENLAR